MIGQMTATAAAQTLKVVMHSDVKALDPDHEGRAVIALDDYLSLADNRILELADLIALWKVGIEVVLPVKQAPQIDLRLEAEPGPHRLLDAMAIDDWQHAGHGHIDQADLLVRSRAKADRGSGKQLGVRCDLGVDFQAQNDFPMACAALYQL